MKRILLATILALSTNQAFGATRKLSSESLSLQALYCHNQGDRYSLDKNNKSKILVTNEIRKTQGSFTITEIRRNQEDRYTNSLLIYATDDTQRSVNMFTVFKVSVPKNEKHTLDTNALIQDVAKKNVSLDSDDKIAGDLSLPTADELLDSDLPQLATCSIRVK